MNILLDQNNVALFIGTTFTVTDTCILFSDDSVCNDLNSSNTSVIDTDPPQVPVSNAWKWENNAWVCVNQDIVDSYLLDQTQAFNASQSKLRHATYIAESDPIFFKCQRQEATQQEWLDKIAEIDARYPYRT